MRQRGGSQAGLKRYRFVCVECEHSFRRRTKHLEARRKCPQCEATMVPGVVGLKLTEKPKPKPKSRYKMTRLDHMARWHTKRGRGTVRGELISHLLDFQDCKCWYCDRRVNRTAGWKKNWVLEHKTPLSRGGTNEASNLVIACRLCNKLKGTKTAEEFLACTNRPGAEAAFQARGTGPTNGGASLRGTPGDASHSPGIPTEPREETCTTSQTASMVNSRGVTSAQYAMPNQARGEGEPNPGDASRLSWPDVAYRQSLAQEQSRPSRCGTAEET